MDPAGAALGAVFGVLLNAIIVASKKTIMFKSHFRDLKSKLDSLKKVIGEVEDYDSISGEPTPGIENLKKKMQEGAELVDKCSKVRPWKVNSLKKFIYTNQLVNLGTSLDALLTLLFMHVGNASRVTIRNIETYQNQIRGGFAVPEPPSFTVGLDVPLRELKMKLLSNDVSVLVVTGHGGIGKTTLAKMFCQDKEVKEKFDKNIFFVTVLRRSNSIIVQELCKQTRSQVPAFQNEAVAFNWLEEFLQERGQNPLLLVLDDVWPGSEPLLEKCYGFRRPHYKILVTSRSHFKRFGTPYCLEALKDEDAMRLFHNSASPPGGSSYIPEDLERQIVEKCLGSPLAITVVGRSLCGQPVEIWKTRLTELMSDGILDSEQKLLFCLRSSLDAMDKEMPIVKECLIDLSSFPEDQRIPAAALIDMWAELYGPDEDYFSMAYIHELTTRSLANLVTRKENREIDGYYGEHFVTQHNMLRNLAIHQTGQDKIGQGKRLIIDICGDSLPNWWVKQRNKPKKTRLLSISTDGLFSAKWHNMHLPKAEVLLLNFQTKNYALPKFLKKMPKLKVLIVAHNGFLQADLSNIKLLGFLSNLKRIRLEGISIPSISKNSMQLKSLQKISLFMCNIGQAFSNPSIQIFEAFPNLVELNIDYCNDLVELPAKLCDLIHLKKLSITSCHKLSALPEDIGKLANLELLRLRSCTDLERLPGSIKNLTNLHIIDIYKCFSIKELPEDIGEMSGLEKINIGQCSRLQQLPVSVLDLEQLKEVICDEDTEILWGEPFLSNLRDTMIRVIKEEFNLNWLYKLQF